MNPRDKANDRRRALRLIVDYICNSAGEKDNLKNLTQIYEGAGLTKTNFDSIWSNKSGSDDNEAKLRNFLLKSLKDKRFSHHPDWIITVLQYAFPREHSYIDYINIFSSCSSRDDGLIDEIAKAYVGVYTLYRYASNISAHHDPNNARVIRAAMHIRTDKSSKWPLFSIKFNPNDRYEQIEKVVNIDGRVLISEDKSELYLTGIDTGTSNKRNPVIIITSNHAMGAEPPVIKFFGFVTRKHQNGSIIASKVIFVRSTFVDEPEDVAFKKECNLIKIYKESELKVELSDIRELISNNVGNEDDADRNDGKGVLILGAS